MVKKIVFAFAIIFLIIFSISSFFNVKNNTCTTEEAIKIAQEYVKSNNKDTFVNTITNFDVPKVELLHIDKLVTYNAGKENTIKNKECYKVTFNYPLDLFVGPYDVYIEYNNGKCYGATLKY